MYKKKSILITLLVLVLSLGSLPAFADSGSFDLKLENNNLSESEMLEHLKENGIEVSYIKAKGTNDDTFYLQKAVNNSRTLESKNFSVSSVEEMQSIIDEVKTFDKITNSDSYSMSRIDPGTTEGVARLSKWAPLFGTFCWKNISFQFETDYSELGGFWYFKDVDSRYVTSHISGLSGFNIQWNHDTASKNISSDLKQVNIKAMGHYLLGFDFGDFELGVPINSTWRMQSKDCETYLD